MGRYSVHLSDHHEIRSPFLVASTPRCDGKDPSFFLKKSCTVAGSRTSKYFEIAIKPIKFEVVSH
jgi:hypothetical protein